MKPKARTVLAVITVVGFVLLTGAFFVVLFMSDKMTIPDGQLGNRILGMLGMVVGVWTSAFATVINFNFGSSQGSKDKQDMLKPK